MLKNEIHLFLNTYFKAAECTFLEETEGSLTVKLTPELDKELMNRPFYWHYAEKTGMKGEPLSLTLITEQSKAPKELKGESVHFGTPRLQQIFQSAKQHTSFIRLYEQKTTDSRQALHPWLLVNMKVSYEANRKKDMFHSFGLNLINGVIQEDFMGQLSYKSLVSKIPDYSFTITPLIKPTSGVKRLQRFLTSQIENENHDWAVKARMKWNEDLTLLDDFYENEEKKPEAYFIEKAALEKQYSPRIYVDTINGGLIYLHPSSG
ncbi:YqhG family protein [Bacillus sp. B190/17]|uniref:YqhG family protein n=1 Tax=Bacillus lumedeiriae TaxID=3058829 RepID=A0ABW8I589_9BACI